MSGKSMYVCMYVSYSAFWGYLPYCDCFILCMLLLLQFLFVETCSLSGEMHLFIIKIKRTRSLRWLKLISRQVLNTGQIMNCILNFFAELGIGVTVFSKMGGYFLAYVVSVITARVSVFNGFFIMKLCFLVYIMLFQRTEPTLVI